MLLHLSSECPLGLVLDLLIREGQMTEIRQRHKAQSKAQGDGSMCYIGSPPDACLQKLREEGVSIRQLSGLTGISYSVVRKY